MIQYEYYFEKLDVWQLSRQLTKEIYRITNEFPSEEKYGLTSQIRRASVSVASNLAEGSSRSTKKDQANFTTMAYSSLMETLNLLILASDLEYVDVQEYKEARTRIQEISNKLNALRKSKLSLPRQIHNSTNGH
jgi:four helix bundle protein